MSLKNKKVILPDGKIGTIHDIQSGYWTEVIFEGKILPIKYRITELFVVDENKKDKINDLFGE